MAENRKKPRLFDWPIVAAGHRWTRSASSTPASSGRTRSCSWSGRQHPDDRACCVHALVGRGRGAAGVHPGRVAVAVVHGASSPTSPRRWPKAAAKAQADGLRKARGRRSPAHKLVEPTTARRTPARLGRRRCARATWSWSRPASSSRPTARSSKAPPRVDESAITGESAPVIRESGGDRSRRHRRHAGPVRLADRPRDGQPRRDVPRPHDRHGRRGQAAEDAQRDRPEHPAGGPDDHLPGGLRHAAALLAVQRPAGRPAARRSPSRSWWRCWCAWRRRPSGRCSRPSASRA